MNCFQALIKILEIHIKLSQKILGVGKRSSSYINLYPLPIKRHKIHGKVNSSLNTKADNRLELDKNCNQHNKGNFGLLKKSNIIFDKGCNLIYNAIYMYAYRILAMVDVKVVDVCKVANVIKRKNGKQSVFLRSKYDEGAPNRTITGLPENLNIDKNTEFQLGVTNGQNDVNFLDVVYRDDKGKITESTRVYNDGSGWNELKEPTKEQDDMTLGFMTKAIRDYYGHGGK